MGQCNTVKLTFYFTFCPSRIPHYSFNYKSYKFSFEVNSFENTKPVLFKLEINKRKTPREDYSSSTGTQNSLERKWTCFMTSTQIRRELTMPLWGHTLLDDNVVQPKLHLGSLHDALLDRVLCEEAEHVNLLLLPDTMSTVLSVKSTNERHYENLSFESLPHTWNKKGLSFLTSERRPQNIYSQEEMNLYCIIKLATEISLFSLQISKTWCFGQTK